MHTRLPTDGQASESRCRAAGDHRAGAPTAPLRMVWPAPSELRAPLPHKKLARRPVFTVLEFEVVFGFGSLLIK